MGQRFRASQGHNHQWDRPWLSMVIHDDSVEAALNYFESKSEKLEIKSNSSTNK